MRSLHGVRSKGALLVAIVALPIAVRAQSPTTYGIVAGPALPLGVLSRIATTGARATAFAETASRSAGPIGRLEASFDRFTANRVAPGSGRSSVSVYSLTANVVAGRARGPIAGRGVQGYFVGGLGIYTTRTDVGGPFGGIGSTQPTTRAHVGANGGAGLNLPLGGLGLFAEARLHGLLASGRFGTRTTGYIPIVLGVRF